MLLMEVIQMMLSQKKQQQLDSVGDVSKNIDLKNQYNILNKLKQMQTYLDMGNNYI